MLYLFCENSNIFTIAIILILKTFDTKFAHKFVSVK